MIWATVSSRSCFCWLYRASPSLAAKNITNLISVLIIWWCLCVKSFLMLLKEGASYDQCILLAKLLALPCFILYSKAKLACSSRYLLTLYFCIPVLYEKDIFFFFLVLVPKGLIGLRRTIQPQLLWQWWLVHRLGLLWYWMVCLGNKQKSFILETAPKYCILYSFVDYAGYFISSEEFLPTVVDIMVIWIKFAHSGPF